MRGIATTLASVMALSFLVTGASAQTAAPVLEPEAPLITSSANEPASTVPLFEYSQPVPVAQAPMPQARPALVAAVAQPRPPVVVSRPAPVRAAVVVPRVVSQPAAPRVVAYNDKPKSPLFWMTVGVGF